MSQGDEQPQAARFGVPLLPGWLRVGLVLAVALLAAYLSLAASTSLPEGGQAASIGLRHALLYAALGLALAYALAGWSAPAWRKGLLVLAVAASYGAGLEVLQLARPTRSFELVDLAANTLGAALGATWCWLETRLGYRRWAG